MKAIMVMFDSLNRDMLPAYGCDWIQAPNFKRLQQKTVTFDKSFAGSLPCMPARRELHTGRHNFLHRGWGPLEPFDHSMPEILKQNGVYTHLVSDHQHYWEDGGATYHPRYSSWESVRGQEGDPWKGHVKDPEPLETETPSPLADSAMFRQDQVNRMYFEKEEDHPQAVTFSLGMDFIKKNKDEDNWFLQLETFDPHEPFFSYERYKNLYPHDYDGKFFDWPPYDAVEEGADVVEHGKLQYAALLSMCDHYLGKVLDMMDDYDMWKDTMLIVNTDHGYLLGEHGWWSKSIMPVYREIAHTPLFVWDPRLDEKGTRRESLVQTIDIPATLLDFFGMDIPEEMEGKPLRSVIETDKPIRNHALFGYHGGHVNITDGKYVYMRGTSSPENGPLFEYTLMPTHMREMFRLEELTDIDIAGPLGFTRGAKVMKIQAGAGFVNPYQFGSKLFDIEMDPAQMKELDDPKTELSLIQSLAQQLKQHDAPAEQYVRLGIPEDGSISEEALEEQKQHIRNAGSIDICHNHDWTFAAQNQLRAILNLLPEETRPNMLDAFETFTADNASITSDTVKAFILQHFQDDQAAKMMYFAKLAGREQ